MSWLMFLHQFLLLFLLSSSSSSSSSSSAHHTCLEDQRFSLLQFKTTFTITANASLHCESDSYPKMVFWNESTDCCSWEGVTCDWSNGYVIGLDLSCSHLQGTIQPNSTLFHLRHLQTLNLAFNDFNFSIISPDFGSFASLTHLNLSDSKFTGRIPSKICHLSKLVSLDLSYFAYYNKRLYVGRLEQHTFNMMLRNLTQLRELHLDWLNISSPLPHALLNLSSLTSLSLADCQLRGKFSNIFHLPNLRKLHLQYNFELTENLIYLDLSYNGLSLSVNNSVNSTLTNFNTIRLASCNLSEFPNFLREQTRLRSLDLSNNKIHGEVPKWIFDVGKDSLDSLNISHNFLTSLECLPWKNLAYIDLQSNLLRGPLPVPPSTTYVFFISNNKLTGEIPTLICDLSHPLVLDLSNNSFSGSIPQCLGNLSNSLSVLNLAINRFCGTFTATFTKGNMLRNLNLNGNQIEGQVPRSLLNCRRLEVLDLGKNKINDTFPHWLGTLRNLQVLVLRFNRFHGHIGTFKTKGKHHFPMLRIIDMSYNDFTGLLPTNYIKQFEAMMNVDEHEMKLKYMGETYYQDSVVVVMKGLEIEYSRILTVFSIIDLSSNNFQGEIPKSIEKLNSLRGLNLSHNNLTGHIPTSLGNLKNLESLDLSSNKLVGEIPQQLTSLMFLEVLNLSDNQLEGPIPQGRQFYTFENDSYSGNLALCGIPLSKKCKELQALPHSPTFQQDENSDKSSGFSFQVVVMGYGCGFVFGMVTGYLMFLTRSPEWLMKIVEGKQYKKVKRSKKSAH